MLEIVLLALTSSFVWPGGNYIDRRHLFRLRVPAGYVSMGASETNTCLAFNPKASICLKYPPKHFIGTNFASAFLDVRILSATTEKACTEAADPDFRPDSKVPIKTIDRTEFRHTIRGGAAAGMGTRFDRYGGFERGECFEITEAVSHFAIANYGPGSIREFTKGDEAKVTAELNGIIASFHALPRARP